jgi:hypothetical protein
MPFEFVSLIVNVFAIFSPKLALCPQISVCATSRFAGGNKCKGFNTEDTETTEKSGSAEKWLR